ncbi:MAG: hypothetical protein HY664_00755 [Chloroflexi bacterium]|nr:hypothetical protein [Chloroflexota bacterium]
MDKQNTTQNMGRRNWPARLWLFAIALGLLALFIAENFVSVEIRLLVIKVETRLAWGLLLAGLLGFVAGLIVPRLRK